MNVHPTHKTRFTDASSCDEVCTQCGANDGSKKGLRDLAAPCLASPGVKPSGPQVRCYCCGEAVGEKFALVPLGTGPADRCMVFKWEHANRSTEPFFTVTRD